MNTFEIYYSDFTKEAQKSLCDFFETTPEEENWEVIPLTVIERGDEREESENLASPDNT